MASHNWINIGSGNDLTIPNHTISWRNVDLLSLGSSEAYFEDIYISIKLI